VIQDDVIRQWKEGAAHELRSAKLLAEGGEYSSALFHCHLAVEKALKSKWAEQHATEPPYTHNLVALAENIGGQWTEEEKILLGELSHYSAAARYADALWMQERATQEECNRWIGFAEGILSRLLQ
jgi:HEPN domain-containing protein